MKEVKVFTKGNINEKYSNEALDKKLPLNNIELIYKELINTAGQINKEACMEISHNYTPSYKILTKEFKEMTFLSDDPFESMLAYHQSKIDNCSINVLNYSFDPNTFASLKITEKYDLIFSVFGMHFEDLYSILPSLSSFLKVEGILALCIPSYWFSKGNISEIEKKIMSYSKQNDKKWIFVEPIEPIISENNAELIENKETSVKFNLNRLELSKVSSLNKLHDSILQNNIAHLEVLDIPENNIELSSSLLLIRKTKKTINKDNLFNL